jgi:hypothetical protein
LVCVSFPSTIACSFLRTNLPFISVHVHFMPCFILPLWSSGQSSWLHNGDVLCFL